MKKFLTSAANVYGYDENDRLVLTALTATDTSLEATLGSTPVRGGRGNQIHYIYYHTAELKLTLTDVQWNLALLASTVGDSIHSNTDAYKEVTGTLTSATAGTIPADIVPLKSNSSLTDIYGWATTADGSEVRRVKFTAGTPYTFTVDEVGTPSLGTTGDKVCVRLFTNVPEAQYIDVKSNMIPKVLKIVMEAQLNSGDVTSNKVGMAQIIIPRAQLSGAFTISMKADGTANTPLSATALSYQGAAGLDVCETGNYYARIIEVIDSANWYDKVVALAIAGGDFSMAASTTKTLEVWAVPINGDAFKVTNSELTFALDSAGTTELTVGAHTGLVTAGTLAGTATVSAFITDSSDIDVTVNITVTA